MIRRSAFSVLSRVLLSLVLLLSQQMAMSHALSHWSSQAGGPVVQQVSGDTELAGAFAQDRSCAQCLGLAQLAAPFVSSPRAYVAPELAAIHAPDAATLAWRVQTTRAYDSRAPPVPA